jgi:hypothetical protein
MQQFIDSLWLEEQNWKRVDTKREGRITTYSYTRGGKRLHIRLREVIVVQLFDTEISEEFPTSELKQNHSKAKTALLFIKLCINPQA